METSRKPSALAVKKYLTVASLAAIMTVAPALAGGISSTFDSLTAAYAKSDNAGGNGHGGGNGNGNGGGNAGGNSASNASSKSSSQGGKNSGFANADSGAGSKGKGKGKGGDSFGDTVNSVGVGVANFVGDLFGGKSKSGKGKSHSAGASGQSKAVRQASLKSVDAVPTAHPYAKEKNFHAKLAGLNSLGRNFRALEQSNSPKLAAIQDYIDAVIGYEDALAALGVSGQELEMAREVFAAELANVVAYDDFAYDGKTLSELQDRLTELENVDRTGLTADEINALDTEIGSLTTALESEAAMNLSDAEAKAMAAEETANNLEPLANEDALKEALLAAANENRVAEYGEDYVDQEMLDWASDLLGVGDAYGKIDQIREAREAQAAAEPVAVPEIEPAIAEPPAEAPQEEPSAEAAASPEGLRLTVQ